jgi:miniconductance mechanosensitive channel
MERLYTLLRGPIVRLLEPLNLDLESDLYALLVSLMLLLVLAGICVLANWISKSVILRVVHHFVARSRVSWDNKLMDRKVFTRLSHLVPGILLYHGAFLFESAGFTDWLQRMALAYLWFAVAYSLHALLNALQDIYRGFSFSVSRPITGYIQTLQLIVWFATVLFVVASILNRSPVGFLTGLGALSAVLMLIFRDSILGLVAGIQITANDMVRIGDWISMPAFGADGDVIDIGLHTVKIQNFDRTISTVPTHALITNSFQNWRGMQESGGRRIKRSLMMDLQSVRFCDKDLLKKLETIEALKGYLAKRRKEVEAWNAERHIDGSCPLNGRRLTNLGTFRAYVEAYLREHPQIHQEGLTFLVRQLAPTEKGVPIELYVFVKDIRWNYFEAIQSDIFDHLIAAVPWFDLALYQAPAGRDVRAITGMTPGEKAS